MLLGTYQRQLIITDSLIRDYYRTTHLNPLFRSDSSGKPDVIGTCQRQLKITDSLVRDDRATHLNPLFRFSDPSGKPDVIGNHRFPGPCL
jgi:hypothetical protein